MDYQIEAKEYFERVIAVATNIILKSIPKGVVFELYLIGSSARDEMTILYNSNEKVIMSDMEFYIITNMKQMIPFIEMVNRKLGRIGTVSVEINGTNYNRFEKYQPKQWIIDAAQGAKKIATSENCTTSSFELFVNHSVPSQDIVFLLLNRIIEYESERDIYFLIKMYVDIAGALLYVSDEYTASVKERLSKISDTETSMNLLMSTPVTENQLDNLKLILGYKLFPSRKVGIEIENNRKSLEKGIIPLLKWLISTLVNQQDNQKNVQPEEDLKALFKQRGLLLYIKEWVQDLSTDFYRSVDVFFTYGLTLTPRGSIFYRAAKEITNPNLFAQNRELYSDWIQLCKSA